MNKSLYVYDEQLIQDNGQEKDTTGIPYKYFGPLFITVRGKYWFTEPYGTVNNAFSSLHSISCL